MAVPPTALQPDPVFFPMAEFQVDGFLFRVPLYIFQQSPYFQENVLTQDWSADAPYELQDTTATEFRDLLRCILPMAGPFPSGPMALTNVLKLATRWKFEFARRVAIQKINYTIDKPALKLALAREYDVKEFLPSALSGLIDATALEVEDYEVLSLELVSKVVKYRERSRCAQCEQRESAAKVDPDRRRRLVEEVFGPEFARDYKKGEDILSGRVMAVTQRPPPSHWCRRS